MKFCPVCDLYTYKEMSKAQRLEHKVTTKTKYYCTSCGYIAAYLQPNNTLYTAQVKTVKRPVSAIKDAHLRVILRRKLLEMGFNGEGMSLRELQIVHSQLGD